jgi:hypothetical protein
MKSSFESLSLPGAARFAFVPADRTEPLAIPPLLNPTESEASEEVTRGEASESAALEADREAALADETRAAIAALNDAADGLRASRASDIEAWGSAALEAGLILARRVLERELSVDPEALMPLIERAVASLDRDEPIAVLLHPDDLERLEQRDAATMLANGAVTLLPEAGLARGEASVSNRASRIEVRVETLLESLREECLTGWEASQ